MYWPYWPSKIYELLRIYDEANEENIDESQDVIQNQYPNYSVIDSYESHGERALFYPTYRIIMGGGMGLMTILPIGGFYYLYKYRKEGYRGFYLIEKMTSPVLKSALCGLLLGFAIGAKGVQFGPNRNTSQIKSN